MKKILKYDVKNYSISQIKFNENFVAKTESIMAIGNGYLGLRSVDEEIESFNKEDFLVNGIFNKDSKEEVTEIANLADLIQTSIYLDGTRFSINKNDEYLKTINLKNGLLIRKIIAKRNKKEYKLIFKRFVSQHNKHIYAQKINIKQISGKPTKLVIYPKINGQTTNYGTQHFKEGFKKRKTLKSIQYFEETTFSNRYVAHNMILLPYLNEKIIKGNNDNFIVTMNRRQVGFKIQNTISKTKNFVLEKLMSVNTSIENELGNLTKEEVNLKNEKLHNLLIKKNFDILFKESTKSWSSIWDQFKLKIKGKSKEAKYDKLAFIFSIFHLNSFVPKENSNLSIGAKGLSGEGYQGHSFWDNEFFIIPNYLFTKPTIARNLLEYRYKGIEGARKKAKEKKERIEESNLNGAQYPWEMAWPTDGEVCPYWGQPNIVTGEQIPIASRRQEIHVSADIAYAIDQYYDFTNDDEFMNEMGYEMIIDTAIFWTNRAEKQKNGEYMIKDVMGPNEYKGNIDNSAYINAFAVKNIDLAIKYINKLNKTSKFKKIFKNILSRIPYKIPIKLMKEVREKLVQQKPNNKKIIAENDQFLKLEIGNLKPFQLLGDAGKKLFNTQKGINLLSKQIVKQADVVLLTFLMPYKFQKNVIKKNFEYYEPLTTHDSSLSSSTYAIQAIDLKKMDLAYKLFKYSLEIDMGLNMKSSDKGIHAGAIAAIWQTIVFGYGGLRWIDGILNFNPILPLQWEGLEYQIKYKNLNINVSINKHSFTINLLENKKLKVMINNKEVILNNSKQIFLVKNDY